MNSRHFILTPVGSSGDVHPYVGLGRILQQRGHEVSIISGPTFQKLIEASGASYVGIGTEEDFNRVTQDPDLWHPRRGLKVVLGIAARMMREGYDAIARIHQPGRSVLVGHGIAFHARVFEDKHHTPAATLHLAPAVFRSDHQQPVHLPGRDLSWMPRFMKRAMWWLVDKVFADPHMVPLLNRWRRELGLPGVSRVFRSWMHSPQRVIGLFPDWFGPPQPDWPAQLKLTGFPLFDEAGHHELDPSLEAFLQAGSPPIVFTPGSANRQADRFFAAGIEAARLLNRRALLLSRYPEQLPAKLPDHVLHLPYVPFSQVLPRCAAIAHHGGIGTCAQALAAGIPQLVMPLGFDQPDNVARLQRLGVGTFVVPSRFKGKRVADALRTLLDSGDVKTACATFARKVRDSHANERTCELLEAVGPSAGKPAG